MINRMLFISLNAANLTEGRTEYADWQSSFAGQYLLSLSTIAAIYGALAVILIITT